MDVVAPQVLDRDNPWPGLTPFSEAAQGFFHGREQAGAELARRVRRDRLTVLFGKSGLGKTSLLNAGLFPLLRAADFLPVYIRLDFGRPELAPVEQIKTALRQNLAAWDIDGWTPLPDETLWGFFHNKQTEFWTRRNRLVTPVLVFDQFEEIVTLGQGAGAAAALVAELAALIENRPPEPVAEALNRDPDAAGRYDFAKEGCKIVIALREDFLPELEGLQGEIPSIMSNRMRLTRMNGQQAQAAILRSGGHLIDEGVAERIIAFVAASRERAEPSANRDPDLAGLEIEPALLSIVCRELNNKRQRLGHPRITADLLADAQHEIVADFYNGSLADLDPAIRLFIEDQLLTAGGYRDSEPLADALMVPGITRAAIDLLVERRLLRIEERSGTQWLELTHDLLTQIVREQRDTRHEAQEAQAQRERAERAEAEARTARRVVHRTRIALAATAAALVVAVAAFFFAIHETRRADERAEEAAAQRRLADERTEEVARIQLLVVGATLKRFDLQDVLQEAIKDMRAYEQKIESQPTDPSRQAARLRELSVIHFSLAMLTGITSDEALGELSAYDQIVAEIAAQNPGNVEFDNDRAASLAGC